MIDSKKSTIVKFLTPFIFICLLFSIIWDTYAYSIPKINKYINNVLEIKCIDEEDNIIRWSSFLYYLESAKQGVFFTNKHIVQQNKLCWLFNDDGEILHYFLPRKGYIYNTKTDFISYKLPKEIEKELFFERNFLKDLYFCWDVNVGDKVWTIWYPSYWVDGSNYAYRITTTGIVAWLRNNEKFTYPNYFVTNRIDSWNSWGLALMENSGEFCILWLPTWLQYGNYDNIGVVQNIHNVTEWGLD